MRQYLTILLNSTDNGYRPNSPYTATLLFWEFTPRINLQKSDCTDSIHFEYS